MRTFHKFEWHVVEKAILTFTALLGALCLVLVVERFFCLRSPYIFSDHNLILKFFNETWNLIGGFLVVISLWWSHAGMSINNLTPLLHKVLLHKVEYFIKGKCYVLVRIGFQKTSSFQLAQWCNVVSSTSNFIPQDYRISKEIQMHRLVTDGLLSTSGVNENSCLDILDYKSLMLGELCSLLAKIHFCMEKMKASFY